MASGQGGGNPAGGCPGHPLGQAGGVQALSGGYIKLYRSLLDWEWYDEPNTLRLFLHLLLTVNFEEKSWRGVAVKRGQRITSYGQLAEETKISVQSIRTAIKHLKSTGELTHQATPQYGLFTVVNYDKYQAATPQPSADQPADNSQQTDHQQQLKKDKKEKKEKKEESGRTSLGEFGNVSLSQQEHQKLIDRFGNNETARAVEELSAYCRSRGRAYKDYYATLISWCKRNQEREGSHEQGAVAPSRRNRLVL